MFRPLLLFFAVIAFSCGDKNDPQAKQHGKTVALFSEEENELQEIALQPFGKLDTHYVFLAKKELEAFYNCKVNVLPRKPLPATAYYQPRDRYKADSLLDWLALHRPEQFDRVVGLTDKDISTRKEPYDDWGVMGLGECPGVSCVISTFRLKKNAEQQKIDERFAKVVLHETGHTFGLEHCSGDTTCFMEDASGTIQTVDRERKRLCKTCSEKASQYLR